MNFPEIYEKLKQTPKDELLKAKNILEEYDRTLRVNWVKNTNKNNPQPIDYLVHACIEDDVNNGRANRQQLYYPELNAFSLFRTTDLSKRDHHQFLQNLPVEFHPYIPSNISSRLKKILREEQIKESTKALQLNEFSYLAFKASLDTSKKKPSGIEAITQIENLPKPNNTQEQEIYDKFLALYWSAIPKKSIPFCDKVCTKTKNTEYSPIFKITHFTPWDSPTEEVFNYLFKLPVVESKSVTIDFYFYQKVARAYHIPVLQELYTERYSEHHIYYSGISKVAKLTDKQLEMVVSQILILDYIIKHIQPKELNFPYFQKMRDFLVQEIKNPEYNIKKLLEDIETGHAAAVVTCKDLQKELA